MTSSEPHYGARISTAVSAIITLMLIGTFSYHHLERWNWMQSFYFTVTTIATVGYGDLHPTTDSSRLFTAIFILVGVAVAVTALGVLGAAYLEQRTARLVDRSRR